MAGHQERSGDTVKQVLGMRSIARSAARYFEVPPSHHIECVITDGEIAQVWLAVFVDAPPSTRLEEEIAR